MSMYYEGDIVEFQTPNYNLKGEVLEVEGEEYQEIIIRCEGELNAMSTTTTISTTNQDSRIQKL
ncbi:hypothetical protein [Xanthovirga aplysinae]|uniref:hypothetical protein n=1 Tax=Xanthovirga aplysinae TaxID=2529853 RepID=UPI0012BD05A7|nr:hypothetical protein [Xanthovirga aplysinae]MTI30209.1 hypothetical protein [Xanthovirga aplysinae]